MPSENKTPNYELNQWQGNEYLKRQDLVDDNSKIDAALTPTADPTKIPTSNGPFKLVNWVSYFANRIKAITGKANWWESPSKTLEDVNTHLADYEYKTATVVSRQIRTTKESNTNIIKFRLASNITNGTAITISLDGGATSHNLKDIDGINLTELDKGFVEVINDGANFTLRPRGGAKLDGNANVEQVLSGVTFYNNDPKTKLTGIMPNRGAVNQTITTQGGSYTIPQGYHSGNGKVTANISAKRYASGSTNAVYNVDGNTYVTITGLSFTPSVIIAELTGAPDMNYDYHRFSYSLDLHSVGAGMCNNVDAVYNSSSKAHTGQRVDIGNSPFEILPNGFKLKMNFTNAAAFSGRTCKWKAYE